MLSKIKLHHLPIIAGLSIFAPVIANSMPNVSFITARYDISADNVPIVSTEQLLNASAPPNQQLRQLLSAAPSDPTQFQGKKVAMLAADGVEEIELTATYQYFQDRGATVDIISPRRPDLPTELGVEMPEGRDDQILLISYMANSGWAEVDKFIDQVSADEYDLAIVPGGAWNPDTLRADPQVISFLQEINQAGKITAAICHGPWVLGDAGLLSNRQVTAYGTIKKDLENAGATYVDEPVVVDGTVITSRAPIDLAPFLNAIGEAIESTKTSSL